MKNSMISIAFAAFVLLTPVFAQTAAIRATVPFDFTVENQLLRAGDYRVMINGPAMLRIARIDGPDVAGIMTECIRGSEDLAPRLVFHRYGERYFLAEAWVGELGVGHQLYASPAELKYARATNQAMTTVLARELPAK